MKRVSTLLAFVLFMPPAWAGDGSDTVPSLELLEYLADMEQNNSDWREIFQTMLDDSETSEDAQEDNDHD